MLIKWIVCKVIGGFRSDFHEAQTQWQSMSVAEGLIAQVGGWNVKNDHEACILAIWETDHAYDLFYRYIHDAIAFKNKQSKTYEDIDILFAEPVLKMRGKADNLSGCVEQGLFLRVADCLVKKGRQDHFTDMQATVWEPAMREAAGMLGGTFSRGQENENQFLVTTFWAGEKDHTQYSRDVVPGCRERSGVADDLESITGRFIRLVPDWKVIPA